MFQMRARNAVNIVDLIRDGISATVSVYADTTTKHKIMWSGFVPSNDPYVFAHAYDVFKFNKTRYKYPSYRQSFLTWENGSAAFDKLRDFFVTYDRFTTYQPNAITASTAYHIVGDSSWQVRGMAGVGAVYDSTSGLEVIRNPFRVVVSFTAVNATTKPFSMLLQGISWGFGAKVIWFDELTCSCSIKGGGSRKRDVKSCVAAPTDYDWTAPQYSETDDSFPKPAANDDAKETRAVDESVVATTLPVPVANAASVAATLLWLAAAILLAHA